MNRFITMNQSVPATRSGQWSWSEWRPPSHRVILIHHVVLIPICRFKMSDKRLTNLHCTSALVVIVPIHSLQCRVGFIYSPPPCLIASQGLDWTGHEGTTEIIMVTTRTQTTCHDRANCWGFPYNVVTVQIERDWLRINRRQLSDSNGRRSFGVNGF